MQPESAESPTIAPSSHKRVAICISGLVRTYRETYQNFLDSIINPNQHHQLDVFIHTWTTEHSNLSMERTRRLAWYGNDSEPFPEEQINYEDLRAKYSPAAITIEKQIIFDASWHKPTPGVNIQSLLSMVYKIYACDCLRRHREVTTGIKYDVVIRMRFDSLMPFQLLIDNLDLSVITTPSMMQPQPYPDLNWINDKFAVGNSDTMIRYCDWYKYFVNQIQSGFPIQPETMLANHLDNMGVRVISWGSEMELVRFK